MYTTDWERTLAETMRPVLRALVINVADDTLLVEVDTLIERATATTIQKFYEALVADKQENCQHTSATVIQWSNYASPDPYRAAHIVCLYCGKEWMY